MRFLEVQTFLQRLEFPSTFAPAVADKWGGIYDHLSIQHINEPTFNERFTADAVFIYIENLAKQHTSAAGAAGAAGAATRGNLPMTLRNRHV